MRFPTGELYRSGWLIGPIGAQPRNTQPALVIRCCTAFTGGNWSIVRRSQCLRPDTSPTWFGPSSRCREIHQIAEENDQDNPKYDPPRCPCCSGRMIVIESFDGLLCRPEISRHIEGRDYALPDRQFAFRSWSYWADEIAIELELFLENRRCRPFVPLAGGFNRNSNEPFH